MASRILTRLLETLCRHEFSWPHSDSNGHDYQVCTHCGAVYEYDWVSMRRTHRAGSPLETHAQPGR